MGGEPTALASLRSLSMDRFSGDGDRRGYDCDGRMSEGGGP